MTTPRERVLAAIDHKQTDRAPADYQAHGDVTERLTTHLGLSGAEELLQFLDVDMRRVGFNYSLPEAGPDPDSRVRTMWGVPYDPTGENPDKTAYFSEATTVADVEALPRPDPDKLDYSGPAMQCEQYHPTYATYGAPWCPFFHEVGWMIGQERFYVWMHTKPDVVEAAIRHVVDYELEVTRRYLTTCRGKLDIYYIGNDFGTQRGLFISPDCWERFIRGPLKAFFGLARDAGCRVMKHSCGSVRAIIPQLLEDGMEILDPIQVRAAGMDFEGLVQDFGSRLTLHGGVDTQGTLPFGTPDDVRAEVRGYRACTKRQGGWILCGSQELIEDIPLNNILAMYDVSVRGDG